MGLLHLIVLTLVGGIICIRYHFKYEKDKPQWLEALLTFEILAIAILLIQLLGIEQALTLTTFAFAPYYYWARKRFKAGTLDKDSLNYQLATTFPILVVLLCLRSFFFQP